MALTGKQAEAVMELFVSTFVNYKDDRDRKRVFNDFKDNLGNGISDWVVKCRDKLIEKAADEEVIQCYDTLTENRALKTDLENVVVRKLGKEDLGQVREMVNRTFGLLLTHFEDDKFDQYLSSDYAAVACQGDNILGVILAGEMPDIQTHTIYVDIFAVSENVRGCGVGHKLMGYIKETARAKQKNKLHQIKLQTDRNIEAYKVYTHWGFEEVEKYVHMRCYVL